MSAKNTKIKVTRRTPGVIARTPRHTTWPRRPHDWSAFDAIDEKQALANARSDPDAKPLTSADLKRMKRVSRAKIIRQSLGMSQEEFADTYGIPLGTLRDWEQGRAEPDQAARSYLKVIAEKPFEVKGVPGLSTGKKNRPAPKHSRRE